MSRRRKSRRRSPGLTAGRPAVTRLSEQYVPPVPRHLPELRGQMASWLATEGENFYLVMALAGRQWLPPEHTLAAGAAQVAEQEHTRVTGAQLYWVSAPMTELARHVAASLPTHDLYPHDLPSPAGLMVFEAPLASYVNQDGRQVQIVAVSWGLWDGPGGGWDHGGIWITFYSHPAAVLPPEVFTDGSADLTGLGPLLVPLHGEPGAEGAMLGPIAATLPPVMPDSKEEWCAVTRMLMLSA